MQLQETAQLDTARTSTLTSSGSLLSSSLCTVTELAQLLRPPLLAVFRHSRPAMKATVRAAT